MTKQSKSRSLPSIFMADTDHFTTGKSDSANMHKACGLKVDILGRLHDIPRFFQKLSHKIYFNPKWKKVQSLLVFLRLPMLNDPIGFVLNRRIIIRSLGREL